MRLAALFFMTVAAWAQFTPTPFPALQQYLTLTDAQVLAIMRNNADYNSFVIAKQQRMAQVQAEIAQETAKDVLDPVALGVRYVEIEAICRQMRDESARLREKNLAALTDAQRTKLQALADVMKLFPVISEAQSANILGSAALPVTGYASFLLGYPGNIIPANRVAVFSPAGCPNVGSWFNTNQFVTP